MDFLAVLIESDRRFFKKYQRVLLKIANSRLGRWYFRIQEHPISRKFIRMDANALFWSENGNTIIEFRTSNRYANRLKHTFRFFRYLQSIRIFIGVPVPAMGFLSSPYVLMATYTFNPDAGAPGTNSMDGTALRTSGGLGAGESWSTLRGGAGTSFAGTGTTDTAVRWVADNVSNQWRIMTRGIFTFDTSAIGFGSTIASATFSLFVSSLTTPTDATASKRELRVVSGTASSNLTSADYTNTGGTSFGAMSFAGVTTGAYNDVSLDANGIANISLTGISGFACRSGADLDNSAPTWGSFDEMAYSVAMADTGGTSSDPKLTVTVTAVTKTFTESVTHTETRVNSSAKIFSDATSYSENISILKVITLLATEAVTHTENFVRVIGKVLIETATHTDSKIHALAKIFLETAATTDIFSHLISRFFAEVGSFLENFTIVNLWTKRTKPTTVWTDRIEPS